MTPVKSQLSKFQAEKVFKLGFNVLRCRVHDQISSGKKIVFMWLPNHVGLGGNWAADAAAKAVMGLAAGTVPVPFADFYASVNR
jgi:hypothetical protein